MDLGELDQLSPARLTLARDNRVSAELIVPLGRRRGDESSRGPQSSSGADPREVYIGWLGCSRVC